jgi:S-adenosylmethionine:diacylglycerol 3-amino-3-carboxypropyl transferase
MIYYSHINEDNRIERKLLQYSGCDTAVAICGSGERILALLDNKELNNIHIVDVNEHAIFLFQLKIAALKILSVEEYLAFIGHYPATSKSRITFFGTISSSLTSSALSYWNKNKKLIKKGILNAGHFESFLNRIRPFNKIFLGRRFNEIFKNGYNEERFPSTRWKILKQMFAHKYIYKLVGNRDIAFVGEEAQTNHIPAALDAVIKTNNASSSFMAHLIFKGHLADMSDDHLPPSLKPVVLNAIKQKLNEEKMAINYHLCDLLYFVRNNIKRFQHPVFYSFSDILSFADFDYLNKTISCIASGEAIITGRSFLKNRLTSDQLDKLKSYGDVELYDEQESSGMYQVFSIHTKNIS